MQPRWKRVLNTINGTAGEALGQIYVKHAFPAESKTKMQELVKTAMQEALSVMPCAPPIVTSERSYRRWCLKKEL